MSCKKNCLSGKKELLDFTAVAKKISLRVQLLFGRDGVEKLWNVVTGKVVAELCSNSSGLQGTLKSYRESLSVVT